MDEATSPKTRTGVQCGYRGRVRTGCLTCRSRKIRCDEKRPECNNCTKTAKRRCVYKPLKTRRDSSATVFSPGSIVSTDAEAGKRSGTTDSVSRTYPRPELEQQDCFFTATSPRLTTQDLDCFTKDGISSSRSSVVDVAARMRDVLRRRPCDLSIATHDSAFDITSPASLISRDIQLTTAMDILTAGEVSFQLSCSFFIEVVECPSITPFDGINWQQMKITVVELGLRSAAIAAAIIALSTLYKGQLYGLPLSKATSLYRSTKGMLETLLDDDEEDFGTILATAFLLCLFDLVHCETDPTFQDTSGKLLQRLKSWAHDISTHTELSSRILLWLRILHVTTIRAGGGQGLISNSVYDTFPTPKFGMLRIRSPSQSDTSSQLVQMLSAPMFEFYFQLQIISGDIARLTHYHRSRATGMDQEEVVRQTALIKSRLRNLWDSRSTTQTQTPADLRSHFAPHIADPIISLIGVCAAAYHAEIVEIDRVLGDPVSESTDSKQAMCRIQDIVDGDWSTYSGGKLNAGYLRPLFLYAIECMDHDENQWAVERLEKIKNPICRSDFFASFGRALSDAQLQKGRRVTSKYFCAWYFGVTDSEEPQSRL